MCMCVHARTRLPLKHDVSVVLVVILAQVEQVLFGIGDPALRRYVSARSVVAGSAFLRRLSRRFAYRCWLFRKQYCSFGGALIVR